jgi:hypothetical protein
MTRFGYFQHLAELQSIDHIIFHVHVEQPCPTPRLILLSDSPFHSILATTATPERTNVSLVTTDNQIVQTRPELELETKIPDLLRSLNLLLPGSRILSTHQRTIPNALLSLKPGSKLHRPIQRSPIENLLLAGSWTDTGWPPNLESAIVSGNRCAEAISSHKPA